MAVEMSPISVGPCKYCGWIWGWICKGDGSGHMRTAKGKGEEGSKMSRSDFLYG